jgi:RNA 2',3'-cyclic 3'-phosphodiesterase
MARSVNGVRAFIAIKLNDAAEAAIARFVEELLPLAPNIRWVPRTNFHITLRFLGNEAPLAKLEALGDDLAQIASLARPFELIAQGAGAFPNLARPKAIWIGLAGDGLKMTAAEVRDACAHAGCGPEDHPFSPHLTIARVREPRGLGPLRGALKAAGDRSFGASRIDSIALYRSVFGGSAPAYLELTRWRFGGA